MCVHLGKRLSKPMEMNLVPSLQYDVPMVSSDTTSERTFDVNKIKHLNELFA